MENIINFNEIDLNYLSTTNGQIEANLRFQEQVISRRSQEIKARRLNNLIQVFRESSGLNYQRLLAQSYRLQSQQNLLDLQLKRVREKILSRKFISWSQNCWRYFDVVNIKDNDFTCPICLNNYNELSSNNHILRTKCNHIFCSLCLKRLCEEEFTKKRCVSCPICRLML
jgi:hypothetical protein